MRLLLVWLQHLLIVLPAICTVYFVNVPSFAAYITYFLLALLCVRATELTPKLAVLLLPFEMIGFGWLYYQYGGLLFFLVFSTLISSFLYFRRPIEIGAMSILSNVVLNAVISGDSSQTIWMMNLIWLALTLLLIASFVSQLKQAKLEQVYETLSLSYDQLEQERFRALEYARTVEDYAQIQERGRIATELHDDLGHRLIRVKMMTEAALQIMEHNPQQSVRMIEQVRDQLEESMNNMRYTVRKLKPTEAHNARRYTLHRLIEDAARDMQIEVSFEITGQPYPLYPSIEFVLYRNAQEAITNAVRHGGASAVRIGLDFATDRVAMCITNNGILPKDVAYGMGLKGMQERLAVIGGQLNVSLEHGFVITTVIPHRETRQLAGGE